MELTVLSTSFSEPVTVTDIKDYIGYPTTDQDNIIAGMITTARQWLEAHCALSVVNKQYKAYFEEEDAEDGWYELPVSPVLSSPAVVAQVCGTTVTYDLMGYYKKRIRPATVYGTIAVGAFSTLYYLEVTFNAGALNTTANEIIKKIVASLFKGRQDGLREDISIGRMPYDTRVLIDSINENL